MMMKSGEQLSEILGPAYHSEKTYPEAKSGPKLLEKMFWAEVGDWPVRGHHGYGGGTCR